MSVGNRGVGIGADVFGAFSATNKLARRQQV